MKQIRHFLVGTVCLMSVAALAQWQWTDKDGRKVFSDRAPPADVLEKNILKRPGGRGVTAAPTNAPMNSDPATAATVASATTASAPQSDASAPKVSGVDKDLVEKKKKAQEAEAARRKEEEEKIVKAKADNCARAKQAKAGFDSGRRISRTNDKGEREFLDAAARASEMKRIQSIMDSDCQ